MDLDAGDVEEVIAEPEDTVPASNVVSGLLFLQANGWYILMLSLLLYYLWKSKISHFLERLRKTREEDEEAKCKKDPDLYRAREEARMAAVQKLQNVYNEQAVIMKEKMEERERKKKEELFAKHADLTLGRRLNEDFNPLAGNGEPNYRTPRRTSPSGPSIIQ